MKKVRECLETMKMKMGMAKLQLEMLVASAMIGLTQSKALANSGGQDKVGQIVKGAIDVVVNIFPFIGGFFIVAGVFKLILAYRNDQPEAQAGAAKDIVIGAVFVVFKVFAWDALSGLIF